MVSGLILVATQRFVVYAHRDEISSVALTKGSKDDKSLSAHDYTADCRKVALSLCAPYHGEEVTYDQLSGKMHVYQLRRGHRFSNDDLFAAWRACLHCPNASSLLDLGSGIGSVGLAALSKMRNPMAHLVGIEAQLISFQLASATVTHQALSDRVHFLLGDIRSSEDILKKYNQAIGGPLLFDLVTGSPPYFPEDSARLSEISQRAHCRVELRGW